MRVLGIETSCDETAAAIADDSGNSIRIVSELVSSQIDLHRRYGGVVPEVAAREHVLNILPVIDETLRQAGLDPRNMSRQRDGLDAIAVSAGPGLMSALQTGVETAKALAWVWGVPALAINHIEGHIYSNFINRQEEIRFPALVLTVSGGHTLLVEMKGHGQLRIVGETRDDAAGEAFDKAAQLMGLAYPGGPIIAERAQRYRSKKLLAKSGSVHLPRPMIDSDDLDFSFSGLKTAIRYALQADEDWQERIDEYCHEFEEAVVEVLRVKAIKAARRSAARTLILAGGVSANRRLREALSVATEAQGLAFVMPEQHYTTDNAAMIACAGVFKLKRPKPYRKDFIADPNLGLQ